MPDVLGILLALVAPVAVCVAAGESTLPPAVRIVAAVLGAVALGVACYLIPDPADLTDH